MLKIIYRKIFLRRRRALGDDVDGLAARAARAAAAAVAAVAAGAALNMKALNWPRSAVCCSQGGKEITLMTTERQQGSKSGPLGYEATAQACELTLAFFLSN